MPKYLEPSNRQRELVDLLIKCKKHRDPLQDIADGMVISKQAVKNMLYRVRQSYVSHMKFIEWYRKKRRELNMPGRFL